MMQLAALQEQPVLVVVVAAALHEEVQQIPAEQVVVV
jgi:hypothetical protein